LKTVFVAFYLMDSDSLVTHAQHFVQAETAIKTVIKVAALDGDWRLDEGPCEGIELIVGLHDAQLASLPLHRIKGAKQRLMRVLERESFPTLSAQL
jgi:hypothetical protein